MNTPLGNVQATAELTFSIMHALMRKITEANESMHSKNILRQLDETLENYNTFFDDKKNLSNIARVYMSSTSDNNIQLVSNVLNKKFGENNYALLKGDIGRPELLIEIEGMISV